MPLLGKPIRDENQMALDAGHGGKDKPLTEPMKGQEHHMFIHN